MAVQPATPPTRQRFETVTISTTGGNRRVPLTDPSKPSTDSSSKLAVTGPTDPFKASSVTSSRSSSTTNSPLRSLSGWEERDGLNVVISANQHERWLAKQGSWLHLFEHARYLHAGLPQNAIRFDQYPSRISPDTPLMRNIHQYLSSLAPRTYVKPPEASLETVFAPEESKEQLQAAYKKGSITFSGELCIVKDSRDGQRRVVFSLCPPKAEMGSSLSRKWGSDRFLRIKLEDDVLRAAGPSFDRPENFDTKRGQPSLKEQIQSFFNRPLSIFGRQYSAFCAKDGAVFYFAEKGVGIEKEDERTLAQFAQAYLDVRLNPHMTVAKYCARFELGLTTTTPTVTFPRNRVLRTPDLKSDSLKISIAMMQDLKDLFCKMFPNAPEFLPDSYLPSCIRGSYGPLMDDKVTTPLVWQLDYTSPKTTTDRYISIHEFSSQPARTPRPHFKFTLLLKNGADCSIWYRPNADQIRWVGVFTGRRDVDMTDGCSLMSYSAMQIISKKYSEERGDHEMEPSIPPVAQGRLGPGKGVWAIAPLTSWNSKESGKPWIEVRDSQWKFEDQQTDNFTFELHSIPSTRGQSAKLGKQMFEVLSHCGVPTRVFREMLRSQVETSQSAYWSPQSMPALLYHIERSCGIMEDRALKAKLASDPANIKLTSFDTTRLDGDQQDGDLLQITTEGPGFVHDSRLDPVSAAPNTVPEVVVQMLQNGFEPRQNPHLAAKLKIVAAMNLEKQLSFKVDDVYSRTAFVIADHMGVLEEGEFFFQSTEALPSSDGFGRAGIIDGDALLSRSPAVQPCDVQKVRGVYRSEYRTYYDVIIVSTKGDRSLCSILSGGDYDGDKLICMTNPAIVESFKNASPDYSDPPFKDSDWFEVDKRRVGDYVTPLIQLDSGVELAKVFLETLFAGTQFGLLSKYHTTLAYKLGIADALTSKVGHLFCRALDGRKQGLSFSAEKWHLAKKTFFEPHREVPAWTYDEAGTKSSAGERFAVRPSHLARHPMDDLARERAKLKGVAEKSWREWCTDLRVEIDDDLAREWRKAWSLGLEQREAGSPGFFEDLTQILSHIRTMFQAYKDMCVRLSREKDNGKQEAERSNIPGSPSKRSPTKKGTEWRGSSRSYKDELLAITKRFWSITDVFRSEKLSGDDGARYARSLIASCAYLEPLRATPAPPPVGATSLIDRFRHTTSEATSLSGSSTTPSTIRASSSSTLTVPTTSTPLEEEDEFDDLYGDTRYSQIAPTQPESDRNDGQAMSLISVVDQSTSSSQSSSNPLSPLAQRSTSNHVEHRRILLDIAFKDANQSRIKFCFDMAHRSVLSLKANSITARLHGDSAIGIEAPSVSETMLDVLQVSKRASGIASARLKVRPLTLLPPPSSVDERVSGSPPKRQRLV